jgi:hypothetical protein
MSSLPDRLVIPCLACALAALSLSPAPWAASEVPAQAPSSLVTERRFTRVITRADYERHIEQPFDVPAGTRRVEVEYDVSGREARTVVDLGLRSPSGLRGWSGGGRSTVWVSALGATPGYLSGAIEPGRWAVLLGVPNVRAGQRDTVQIVVRVHGTDLPDGPALAGRGPGWFVGDLHAHSAHSDGRATSRRGANVGTPPHRVFDAAVAAGLDFVALTDHNTASHWLDVDRMQPFYDDLLLLRAREVTTYRGHANAIGERLFHDFRLPSPDASPTSVLSPIARDGAFVSINHPRLPDGEACMGCGWNVSTPEVLSHVHGVEVVNGDTIAGPVSGWDFWAGLLTRGHRLTAVGGSDEHTVDDDRDRRLGRPSTVVWADELSERAVVAGLKRGKAYVRVRGPDGPAIEFYADEGERRVEMGGTVASGATVRLVATVAGADGQQLQWIHDGRVVATDAVRDGPMMLERRAATPGAWYAIVVRGASGPTVMSNAIYVGR